MEKFLKNLLLIDRRFPVHDGLPKPYVKPIPLYGVIFSKNSFFIGR